ncbi:hypothetical protein MTO96_041427 [Rhipicephalus appendiculatus]
MRLIRTLVLNGRAHAVCAYAANGDDTLRGEIHGVPMNTSTENLMAHLRVRTHGVEIITARMIGTMKSAPITFFGPTLPRTVYYYGGELRCYPFRPTIQVCKVCREKGHRTDVCPNPDCPICRLCGLTNPTDGHPCSLVAPPAGKLISQGIQLANRLKAPKPKQPQIQAGHSDKTHQDNSNDPPRTKIIRCFSSEEEEDAYKSAHDKQFSESRSQSPGRKPHSPPRKSAPASPRANLHHSPPGGGPKGSGRDQGHTQQVSSLPYRPHKIKRATQAKSHVTLGTSNHNRHLHWTL